MYTWYTWPQGPVCLISANTWAQFQMKSWSWSSCRVQFASVWSLQFSNLNRSWATLPKQGSGSYNCYSMCWSCKCSLLLLCVNWQTAHQLGAYCYLLYQTMYISKRNKTIIPNVKTPQPQSGHPAASWQKISAAVPLDYRAASFLRMRDPSVLPQPSIVYSCYVA